MALRDLVPWSRSKHEVFVRHEVAPVFGELQHEINRLFDSFYRSWNSLDFGFSDLAASTFGSWAPRVDVREDDTHVCVEAELPGMTDKDISVVLSSAGDVLTLRGEKRHAREHQERGAYQLERAWGRFERSIALPCAVNPDRVEARFKNGVLTVELGKAESSAESVKRIPVKVA